MRLVRRRTSVLGRTLPDPSRSTAACGTSAGATICRPSDASRRRPTACGSGPNAPPSWDDGRRTGNPGTVSGTCLVDAVCAPAGTHRRDALTRGTHVGRRNGGETYVTDTMNSLVSMPSCEVTPSHHCESGLSVAGTPPRPPSMPGMAALAERDRVGLPPRPASRDLSQCPRSSRRAPYVGRKRLVRRAFDPEGPGIEMLPRPPSRSRVGQDFRAMETAGVRD